MDNNMLEKMGNHLEFLGFSIEKIEPKKEGEKVTMLASHPRYNNIAFWEIATNFIMFKTNLTTKKKPSEKINELVNRVNAKLFICRLYTELEDELVVLRYEAVYTGEYAKDTFGQFFDYMTNDQSIKYKDEDIKILQDG